MLKTCLVTQQPLSLLLLDQALICGAPCPREATLDGCTATNHWRALCLGRSDRVILPVEIDASITPWQGLQVDTIFNANLTHIVPWAANCQLPLLWGAEASGPLSYFLRMQCRNVTVRFSPLRRPRRWCSRREDLTAYPSVSPHLGHLAVTPEPYRPLAKAPRISFHLAMGKLVLLHKADSIYDCQSAFKTDPA